MRAKQHFKYLRAGIAAVGGGVPVIGGAISASMALWSESEQEEVSAALEKSVEQINAHIGNIDRTMAIVLRHLDNLSRNNESLNPAEMRAALTSWTRQVSNTSISKWNSKGIDSLRITTRFWWQAHYVIHNFDALEHTRIGDFLDTCYAWINNYQKIPEFDYGKSWILRDICREKYWRSVGSSWIGSQQTLDRRDPRRILDPVYFPGSKLEIIILT